MIPTFGPPPTKRREPTWEDLVRTFNRVGAALGEMGQAVLRAFSPLTRLLTPRAVPDPYWSREAVLARAAVRAGTGQIAVTLYDDGIGAEW